MASLKSRLVIRIRHIVSRIKHFSHHHPLFCRWLAITLAVSIMVMVAIITVHYSKTEGKQEERNEVDRVTNLPGQPPVKFHHYAGYIELRPGQDHKALFYWFFEAQEGASQKPLVLWLNGGTGCSSVAIGAIQEIGPFLVRRNGTQLVLNDHPWNRAANILFLEAPVGVGFSYTNKSEDLKIMGDSITAKDSHDFLINWFKKFPKFKSHEFYIAGESYAGHFAPQLAELVYDRNKGALKESYINLKGFMIGNPVLHDPSDIRGMADYALSHEIISHELHAKLINCYEQDKSSKYCLGLYQRYITSYLKNNSLYDISIRTYPFHPTQTADGHMLDSELFLNRKDVQQALHANITKLSYPYSQCSILIRTWNESAETVLPILKKLLAAGFRIWIYSGDKDGRVPVTATRYAIKEMGLKLMEERSWFHEDRVAGWVETYKGGLVLATVRDAGHQVPVFAPQRSLSIFSHFLSGRPLPATVSKEELFLIN